MTQLFGIGFRRAVRGSFTCGPLSTTNTPNTLYPPVLKICFGPPTAESKNLKNHVNFDVGDLFFRSPALWSSQNVFGPPTAGRVVVDIKDRVGRGAEDAPTCVV